MRLVSAARGVSTATGLLLFLAVAPGALANSAPVVSNVVAAQIPGTGQVRITYDVSDADGDMVNAVVICSIDNGVTFDMLPVMVSGDVNVVMSPGPGKEIIWNAAADYPGRYLPQVVAKVRVFDLSVEMVFVPAGDFAMGGPGHGLPVHTVYLSAFWIDKYEVTNAEFQRFIDAGGYTTPALWSAAGWSARQSNGWTQPAYWAGDDLTRSGPNWPGFPVIGVSWYEAEAYAAFVGKRLPTEAEWEKAARGTDGRVYPWGNSIDGTRANYADSGDPYETPVIELTPVGFYDGHLHTTPPFQTTDSPSPYGAYDMAGNVWEWVKDWYDPYYYSVSPSSNPQGPASGAWRVTRGGSWVNDASTMPSAVRDRADPAMHDYFGMGFRCARSSP